LVFRYQGLIGAKVLLKVDPTDADDVVAEIFISAIRSVFSGATPAELRAWLLTITKRRIADYHRSGGLAAGFELIDPTGGDEDERRAGPEATDEGEIGRLEVELVTERMIAGLSDGHRRVVELYVLEGRSAQDVCERINGQHGGSGADPMTEPNFHQIASRFRAALRAALAGEDQERVPDG
jgi:RNA polymerase sigma factor (sigma-70 family)